MIAFVLVSCSSEKRVYLTVEETVRQCKVCEENGLFSQVNTNYNGSKVVSVTCDTERSYNYNIEYAKIKIDKNKKDTVEKY
jgi:hypothetical protein